MKLIDITQRGHLIINSIIYVGRSLQLEPRLCAVNSGLKENVNYNGPGNVSAPMQWLIDNKIHPGMCVYIQDVNIF